MLDLEWIAKFVLGTLRLSIPRSLSFVLFGNSCAVAADDLLLQFIDRGAGLCGVYGGQVLPPGDAQTKEMIATFDKAMYEGLAQQTKGEI
jgi:hypothetical protein